MEKDTDPLKIPERTDEVQDIIDRMPGKTAMYVAGFVLILALFLVVSGWVIKYPESVRGTVTLSAMHAPVRLVSHASGSLLILSSLDQKEVSKGDVFAVIETAANPYHVLQMDSLLHFSPVRILDSNQYLPDDIVLGELTIPYYSFAETLGKYRQFLKENAFEAQKEQISIKLKGLKQQLIHIEEQLSIQRINLEIAAQNLYKDSLQYYAIKAIIETAYLQTKTAWLVALQANRGLQKEKDYVNNQIQELESSMIKVSIEERAYSRELNSMYYRTYNDLLNQLEQWKQKYAFVAPSDGTLEMLNFWKNGDFIQAGSEIFSIVPGQNPVNGHIFLPAYGAGKVTLGQEVIIKLHDFPYREFGAIKGVVKSVSMLTSEISESPSLNQVQSYLVTVDLPEQLKSNYGIDLSFRHEIKGDAEILTRKRRLLERLFDNLKYMTN